MQLASPASFWLEPIPGVRLLMRPISRHSWRAARRAAGTVAREAPDNLEAIGDEISVVLMRLGIEAWEGVEEVDGSPAPATPENVDRLLADPMIFEALDSEYVMPFSRRLAEGNASAASPNGTGAAEMQGSVTARSPARPTGKAGARSARTGSKSRKATQG